MTALIPDSPRSAPISVVAPLPEALHLPGLDGVRGLAVLAVMLHHIEIYKYWLALPSLYAHPWFHPFLAQAGPQGVRLFFVLSGFLITHLLLREQSLTQNIRVRAFYLRRALRIAPVYYLMVLLTFFVLPSSLTPSNFTVTLENHYALKLAGFIFLAPHLVLSIFGAIFPIYPLWSVGIEEQFYLLWPHFLKKLKAHLITALINLVGICILLKTLALVGKANAMAAPGYASHPLSTLPYHVLFEWIRFDALAIGAIAAAIWHQQKVKALAFLSHRATQGLCLIALPLLIALEIDFRAADDLIYASLFAILILNIATQEKTLLRLRQPWLVSIGRISYGLYVYHTLAFFTIFACLKSWQDTVYFKPLVYLGGFGLAWLLATLSYRYFELPIQRLRKRFTA